MAGWKLLGLVVFLAGLGALTTYVDCARSGPRAQCHAKQGDLVCVGQGSCVHAYPVNCHLLFGATPQPVGLA